MKNIYPLEKNSLLRGQVILMQPTQGFRASLDSVLLAAAALPYTRSRQFSSARPKVLDIGCGVGSVSLCIALKNKNISLEAIDCDVNILKVASLNRNLNKLNEFIDFKEKNVLDGVDNFENRFDIVVSNPPYLLAGSYSASPVPGKAIAHGEAGSGVTLEAWIAFAHKSLRQAGRLVMVHRADRLDHIIRTLTNRRWFGGLVIQPVQSYAEKAARRVLISAVKERYAPLRLNPPLVIHQPGGCYTEKAARLLDGLDEWSMEEVPGLLSAASETPPD